MHRAALFLLGWGYMLAFGWGWSLLPSLWPCPDVVLLMALYASRGPYGPEEVFALGLLSDALGGGVLGVGAAGKVAVFLLLGRTLALLRFPFPFLFPFAFGLSLLDLLVEEGLRVLSGLSPVAFPAFSLRVALLTALFSYPLFALNEALLGPVEVVVHGRRAP